jgi:predicted Zn-dependent protease
MKLNYLPFIIILVTLNVAKANIIRDSEIEETIEMVVQPLKKVTGLQNLKIHLINDPVANAFTIGGNDIFVSSGLIINYPDPDVLRGVVAHEIGHIIGHHVSRRQNIMDNYQKAAISATALGLATATSGRVEEGLGITLGAAHISERSVLAYSREFESSADQTALKLLEKSKHSTIGLIKFFENMNPLSTTKIYNKYEQTHPLSNERLAIIRSFNKRSKFSSGQNNENLIYRYFRTSAKLAAYTMDSDKMPNFDFGKYKDELNYYINAITKFRAGNFDDTLNNINLLIMRKPEDPYYHELKAQLYFEAGIKSALGEYQIVVEKKPDDPLIRLGKAMAGITNTMDSPPDMEKYYEDLKFVLRKEPDNLLALHYMAIYYSKQKMTGQSYLNTAIIAFKSGRKADAIKMATAALKILPEKSPDWYKASDILNAAK